MATPEQITQLLALMQEQLSAQKKANDLLERRLAGLEASTVDASSRSAAVAGPSWDSLEAGPP